MAPPCLRSTLPIQTKHRKTIDDDDGHSMSSSHKRKRVSSFTGDEQVALPQTTSPTRPSTMASATTNAKQSNEQQINAQQNSQHQKSSPVSDQALESAADNANGSFVLSPGPMRTPTPAEMFALRDMASPEPEVEVVRVGKGLSGGRRKEGTPTPADISALRDSASSEPEVEVVRVGEGLGGRRKRSRAIIVDDSSEEDEVLPRRKVAKTIESPSIDLRDIDDEAPFVPSPVESHFIDPQESDEDAPFAPSPASSYHSPKMLKRSLVDLFTSDEDEEEELPSKKRVARLGHATRDTSSTQHSMRDSAFSELSASPISFIDHETPAPKISSSDVIDLTTPPPQPRTASQTPPFEPLQESYLHRLPGELRNRIYLHLGLRSGRLELKSLPEPALAIAIPDLKDELHSVMFSENKLRVPVYSDFRINANDLRPTKPSRVQGFKVGTIAIDPKSWVLNVEPRFVVIKHICFRIMESPKASDPNSIPKLICDYFLNVRIKDGKPEVSHMMRVVASNATKREFRPLCDLGTARATQFAKEEGFEGFTWAQAQEIAASFGSVADAKSKYYKKWGRVKLIRRVCGRPCVGI